jgi:hypothetical protein
MIQRFIELGEGYSDIYEVIEIAKTNQHRIHRLLRLDTKLDKRGMTSVAVVLDPPAPGKLMPIYICREGIVNPDNQPNQRYQLFSEMAEACSLTIHQLEVKHSKQFAEKDLYFQYLIGILRMNRYIPELS